MPDLALGLTIGLLIGFMLGIWIADYHGSDKGK